MCKLWRKLSLVNTVPGYYIILIFTVIINFKVCSEGTQHNFWEPRGPGLKKQENKFNIFGVGPKILEILGAEWVGTHWASFWSIWHFYIKQIHPLFNEISRNFLLYSTLWSLATQGSFGTPKCGDVKCLCFLFAIFGTNRPSLKLKSEHILLLVLLYQKVSPGL